MNKHIQIISQYPMRWFECYKKTFADCRLTITRDPRPDTNPDIMVFMWADAIAMKFINENEKKCKYAVFLRSYEYLNDFWKNIKWDKVDAVFAVNDYIGKMMKDEIGIMPHVIYNGVDVDAWKFKERKHGTNIAMVSFIHFKKNHSLAFQILSHLPEDYTLHCAGDIQDLDVFYYLDNLARILERKIYIHGHIDDIDSWLEDKNYILCTSIREGSPNNIMEAMAKGIKPIIHHYPGAKEQFGNYVFNTVDEAVSMFGGEYNSQEYRNVVIEKFGWKNYQKVREILLKQLVF